MILNLTQHAATPEQVAAGVVDLTGEAHASLISLLTADELPSAAQVVDMAEGIAALAAGYGAPTAMVGGAPWLMAPLVDALRLRGIAPCFAFSRRESVEVAQADGSVRKTAVFRHVGFVED